MNNFEHCTAAASESRATDISARLTTRRIILSSSLTSAAKKSRDQDVNQGVKSIPISPENYGAGGGDSGNCAWVGE